MLVATTLTLTLGIAGCGRDDSDRLSMPATPLTEAEATTMLEALGDPVPSGIGPAVVPEAATPNPVGGPGFFEIDRANHELVIAWYRRHMPPGQDFEGLTWLEELPDAFDAEVDWYWCVSPGRSLDVAIYDDGSIGISMADVTDGACG